MKKKLGVRKKKWLLNAIDKRITELKTLRDEVKQLRTTDTCKLCEKYHTGYFGIGNCRNCPALEFSGKIQIGEGSKMCRDWVKLVNNILIDINRAILRMMHIRAEVINDNNSSWDKNG
jgi:hypothetical protein